MGKNLASPYRLGDLQDRETSHPLELLVAEEAGGVVLQERAELGAVADKRSCTRGRRGDVLNVGFPRQGLPSTRDAR